MMMRLSVQKQKARESIEHTNLNDNENLYQWKMVPRSHNYAGFAIIINLLSFHRVAYKQTK